MNDKPGMAEDFVLNGNCQTTQDQTLKEQLCAKPTTIPIATTLPQTGATVYVAFFLAVVVVAICVVITHKR
jgi:hypothetical protein